MSLATLPDLYPKSLSLIAPFDGAALRATSISPPTHVNSYSYSQMFLQHNTSMLTFTFRTSTPNAAPLEALMR